MTLPPLNKFLLDTNIVSELRKARPHGAVFAWFSQLQETDWSLPAVVAGELQIGIERLRSSNPAKANELEDWLDELLETSHVLSPGAEVFREWARLMQRKPHTLDEDALIAATARVHNMTVATRNTRHFEVFLVPLVNPFLTP